MAGGHLALRRDEGLQSNQKNVRSMVVADLRHVVIRGYRVADVHSPCLAEKIVEIKIGGLAAVTGINPDNSPRCALDSGEKHLSLPGGARRASQAAQPALGTAGVAIGIEEAPLRRRPVHALIDLLAHGCVKAVIALGKAGDPQVALDPRKIRYGDTPRCPIPAFGSNGCAPEQTGRRRH